MSKSRELDIKAKLYILDCLAEDSDGNEYHTHEERIAYLEKRFTSEYSWQIKRIGQQNALQEWLQGLAIPIEFMNHNILELAKSWGSLSDDATEAQEGKILDNYWSLMAAKCDQLIRRSTLPTDPSKPRPKPTASKKIGVMRLREMFWDMHPEYQAERRQAYKQNDYRVDIRMAWVDFVDHCRRDGTIKENIAKRATL